MYVWENLHLAFPVTDAPRAPRTHSAHVETGRHRTDTHRRHPRAGDRGPGRGQAAGRRRRRRADAAHGRRPPAAGLDAGRARRPASSAAAVPNRQYSLCGDPADRAAYRLGMLRDPTGGGGSRYVHDRLAEGDLVRVRGPRNNFALVASPRYLFIAGGIGITPDPADDRGRGGGRRGVAPGLRRAAARLDGVPRRARRLRRPGHRRARRTRPVCCDLATLLGSPRAGHPGLLLRPRAAARRGRAALRGVAARAPCTSSGSPPEPVSAPVRTEAFDVELVRSGLTLTVPPRAVDPRRGRGGGGGRAVLLRARARAAPARPACSTGEPDHRDSVLTAEEQRRRTTAC